MMHNPMDEHAESEATYRGYAIILSKIGNFFILVYNVLYLRRSLADAKELIDDLEQSKEN